MPRILFKDGVTSLSWISKRQIVGEMLSIFIITLTDSGDSLLCKIFENNYEGNYIAKEKNARKRKNDLQYIFTILLAYWAWLKKIFLEKIR